MKRNLFIAILAALAVSAVCGISAFADMADIHNEIQRKALLAECSRSPRVGTLMLQHCVGLANVIGVTNRVYTGSPITFDPVVKLGSSTLTKSTHYTQAFTNNTNVGKASVKITATGTGLFGSITKTFQITPYPITESMVSNITAQAYTGSPVTPTPVVKKGATTLTPNTDYTLSYEDNIATNTHAKLIVTGKGNYGGVAVKEFTIQEQ